MKAGGLTTFEQKNENASNQTQGNFAFVAGGGRTAFQNFLTGNADGLCGNPCTYSEAQTDVTEHLRFNRYEFYAQDTWKPRGERHRRLRRALLALSADHRHEQCADELPAVAVQRGERAEVRQRGVHAHHARHRRPAERDHRRRPELAVRQRASTPSTRATSSRALASRGIRRRAEDDLSHIVRRLLRPGARRDLRAELVHEPAVRQHGEHSERPTLESRRRHDVDDERRRESDRQWRRLQNTADAAVECRRAAPALLARRPRRQLRRRTRRSSDPADRHQLPAAGRRASPRAASTWRARITATDRSRCARRTRAATTGES